MYQRLQLAEGKGLGDDEKGNTIVVNDSEGSDSDAGSGGDKEGKGGADYQKKRKKKTKADIEKEALLMGDLYTILGL